MIKKKKINQLVINLPDDAYTLKMYNNAPRMHSVLSELHRHLRDQAKYGDKECECYREVYAFFNKECSEEGIDPAE